MKLLYRNNNNCKEKLVLTPIPAKWTMWRNSAFGPIDPHGLAIQVLLFIFL